MPCMDGGPSRYDEDREFRKRLNRVEAMLCSTCRVLEESGFDFDKNPELSRWWDAHKKEDEERIKEETRRKLRRDLAKELAKKPVSDLTKEDKKLLREEGYL